MTATDEPVDLGPMGAVSIIDEGSTVVTPTPPPEGTSRARQIARAVIPPVLTFGLIIGVWYYISYGVMNENRRRVALPPPHEVLQKGFLTWEDKRGLRPILEAMLVTGRVALIGLFIATVLGMSIAVVMNLSKGFERAIFPYAVVIQTVPILALVPLLTIWFGFGLTPRVITCVLIAIFPIITNTLFGLQSADRMHHDLFTLHRASRMTRLWKMELPGAMPAIFTGLRIAAGGSVIGAIVGDFFFRRGQIGIGRLIANYANDLRTPELLTATIIASLFGILIFVIFGAISNRVLRSWHESASGR
jgi:NitT/TauT family transport system permease protein